MQIAIRKRTLLVKGSFVNKYAAAIFCFFISTGSGWAESFSLTGPLIAPRGAAQPLDLWTIAVWALAPNSQLTFDPSDYYTETGITSSAFSNNPRRPGLVIQNAGSKVGISIDTRSIPALESRLAPVVLKYVFSHPPKPWTSKGGQMKLTFSAAIPTLERVGTADAYLQATFILQDSKSGKSFWLMAGIFDPRGVAIGNGFNALPVNKATCSSSQTSHIPAISSLLISNRAEYITAPASSAQFEYRTFKDLRKYSVIVTQQNVRAALATLKHGEGWCFSEYETVSENPADWKLYQASILLEAASRPTQKNPAYAHIGREPINRIDESESG